MTATKRAADHFSNDGARSSVRGEISLQIKRLGFARNKITKRVPSASRYGSTTILFNLSDRKISI
jgi:hypothetical protein